MIEPRILEVRTSVLKKNDELARNMRKQFVDAGVLVINLVSSPGTGKTTFLQNTLKRMVDAGERVAAIVGDLETDNDARRLAESGAPARQIMTHGCCHLEADMVEKELVDWNLEDLDYLFIENVGNLVCPTSWDLGESIRVALLSVTEGEDKPLKYPGLFNTSDVAVITKMDLAEPCEFDKSAALKNIDSVRPGMHVFEVSSRTGLGMNDWIDYLRSQWKNLSPNMKTAAAPI
ncbi:MAG: hydrogenase nickel incorporation protein HypB [Pirellulaceae bacterium]